MPLTKGLSAEEALPEDVFRLGEPITQVKHNFWIKFWEEESKTNYEISQRELLSGTTNASDPNIKIVGSLVLKSRLSMSKCVVRLPASVLQATNKDGQIINLEIQGKIGNKVLSTDFIKPDFDEYNEVRFIIEGFIDPKSLKTELKPAEYNYKDSLKLIVEFKD